MATLQPLIKPGSKAMIHFPFTGGASSKFFKFVANTSIEAFSAFFVNSDLIKHKLISMLHLKKLGQTFMVHLMLFIP